MERHQPDRDLHGGIDCDRHDTIPADVRCCLEAAHDPPCVAAAAHLAFGADSRSIILVLPDSEAEKKAKRRGSLLWSADVLAAHGMHEAAALLRARAAAVLCGFPAIPDQTGIPEAGDPEEIFEDPADREDLDLDKTVVDLPIVT